MHRNEVGGVVGAIPYESMGLIVVISYKAQ